MVNPASPCGFRHLRNLSLDEFSGIRALCHKMPENSLRQ
jgi:hypothetical protein